MKRRDQYGSDAVGGITEVNLTNWVAEHLRPMDVRGELLMKNDNNPTYDPADIIITRYLKDWVNDQGLPWWVRSQLLMNTSHALVKLTRVMALRMGLKWVLSRGLELIYLLIADEPVTFLPSRDSYCWNPPHLSPCMVQSRVMDTFLLGAGMFGILA